MRREAEELSIEVHGCIWVIKSLVETKIVTQVQAIELLEKLKLINASLPKEEIEKLIKTYK